MSHSSTQILPWLSMQEGLLILPNANCPVKNPTYQNTVSLQHFPYHMAYLERKQLSGSEDRYLMLITPPTPSTVLRI